MSLNIYKQKFRNQTKQNKVCVNCDMCEKSVKQKLYEINKELTFFAPN